MIFIATHTFAQGQRYHQASTHTTTLCLNFNTGKMVLNF